SGFTLLESLVAVAVVSILIVAIAPMVALSTSARVNARRIDQATQAARSYVDAVRGGVIDTTSFPASLIKNIPNAQNQYTFESVSAPTNSTSLTANSSCQAVTNAVLGSTTVLGSCVDTNGNGFSVDDPQDLFVQPMRSGSTDATILKKQGFWLAVRVYRADALSGSAALRTGMESTCNAGGTAFASTASITCPIVTVRSQILPTTNANNLDDIKTGIGSKP
ncbi:MAG: prepilin-type N-terminal cleavage/methylation domain-containing protein, partial [Pseudanabaena sp.]